MRFKPAAILLGALALAACNDDDDTTAPAIENAQVKVVHAIANAGTVSVRIDNDAPAITNFQFREIRPATAGAYLPIPFGVRRVRTDLAGGLTAIDATPSLAANTNYTVVAAGTAGGAGTLAPAYILLVDDVTAPAAGQVRIRAVHAASSVGNVDIHASATGALAFGTGTRLFQNVPFRASGVVTVPAGNYTLCVIGAGTTPTANGSNCAILQATGALAAGTVATGFAMDATTAAGSAPAIVLTVDRAP